MTAFTGLSAQDDATIADNRARVAKQTAAKMQALPTHFQQEMIAEFERRCREGGEKIDVASGR